MAVHRGTRLRWDSLYSEAEVPRLADVVTRPTNERAARCFRGLTIGAAWFVLGVAWIWSSLAIWFCCPGPMWVRVLVAMAWVAATAWCCTRMGHWKAWRMIAAAVLGIWLIWSLQRPSNDRAWMADQAQIPLSRFDGDTVTIANFRHATYRSTNDYDVRWDRRTFDLNTIERVDYVVEPFASWRGPAHTLLSFEFADGEHVAISVEIRKEQGESFSPLRGLFRQYEIMYVIGDERDLLGLRVNHRKHPVYVYPVRATEEQVRALFVAMLNRANQLAEQPEFYNTLTNTCTTNIVGHLEDLTGQGLPPSLRILLPGYSDSLAFDLGLVDFDGTLEEAQRRFRIPACPTEGVDAAAWSQRIRQGREE